MYKMQKKFAIKFFLILFAICYIQTTNATAQDNFTQQKRMQGTLEFALGFNNNTGFENYSSMYQQILSLQVNRFYADAGFQITTNSLDISANAIFWLLNKTKVRLGAGSIYHYMYYDSLSSTHDFLPGIYLQARPTNKFGIGLDVHYMYKARTIFAIQEDTKILDNHSIAFSLQTDFYPNQNNKVFTKICSYEQFRYNVLCAPSFSIGLKHELPNNNAYLELEGIARFTDLFTLSAYHDSNELRLAFGMYL